MMKRRYSELKQFNTFEERLNYLLLKGSVGLDTFGFDRYLNQQFYRSNEWKRIRDQVIIRDNGCDLGMPGFDIPGKIYVHHMNPIIQTDILEFNDEIMNPEFLVCCSHRTHNAIHYGVDNYEPVIFTERRPNDTAPWKK